MACFIARESKNHHLLSTSEYRWCVSKTNVQPNLLGWASMWQDDWQHLKSNYFLYSDKMTAVFSWLLYTNDSYIPSLKERFFWCFLHQRCTWLNIDDSTHLFALNDTNGSYTKKPLCIAFYCSTSYRFYMANANRFFVFRESVSIYWKGTAVERLLDNDLPPWAIGCCVSSRNSNNFDRTFSSFIACCQFDVCADHGELSKFFSAGKSRVYIDQL